MSSYSWIYDVSRVCVCVCFGRPAPPFFLYSCAVAWVCLPASPHFHFFDVCYFPIAKSTLCDLYSKLQYYYEFNY